MAYIVGLLSKEEEEVLKRRGWEIEPAPKELVPDGKTLFAPTDAPADYAERFKMIWVDTDMFEIMSGPDWDVKEHTNEGDPSKSGG